MYEPASGRFDGLDPYAGNSWDPQSLNKYLYTHADPVNNSDPTGKFAAMIGIGIATLAGAAMANSKAAQDMSKGQFAFAMGSTLFLSYGFSLAVYSAIANRPWLPSLKPEDADTVSQRPIWAQNWAPHISWYKQNVRDLLMKTVEQEYARSGNLIEYEKGRDGADRIAEAYITAVSTRAADGNGSWGQSIAYVVGVGTAPSCEAYVQGILPSIEEAVGTSNWVVKPKYNVRKFGENSHWFFPNERAELTALHSFLTLSYRPPSLQALGASDNPDWIIDPWSTNRPDLYDSATFQAYWPIP